MRLFKILLLSALFIAGLLFTGCQEEPTTPIGSDNNFTSEKFTLQSNWTFNSATLNLRVDRNQSPREVDVRPVNIPWLPECYSWNDFYPGGVLGTEYGAVFHTFTADSGFHSFDVTSLVAGWFADPTTNNGVILMEKDPFSPATQIWITSSEAAEWQRPYLEINYTDEFGDPQTHKEYPLADTWISELDPNDTYCGSDLIRILNFDGTGGSPYVKEGLIQFDLEAEPPVGDCETAYAFGDTSATCFIGLQGVNGNNWGWTNLIPADGGDYELEWPIYAGAGQCDITKGTLVGTLYVDYDATADCVTIEYEINPGYVLDDFHLWVAEGELLPTKKNGDYITAPGQFNHNGEPNPTTICNLDEDFYIAAHFGVCPIVQ